MNPRRPPMYGPSRPWRTTRTPGQAMKWTRLLGIPLAASATTIFTTAPTAKRGHRRTSAATCTFQADTRGIPGRI